MQKRKRKRWVIRKASNSQARAGASTCCCDALSGLGVSLLDLSTQGARIEHSFPDEGGQARDSSIFPGMDSTSRSSARWFRTRLQKSTIKAGVIVYNTGIRFTDPNRGLPAPSFDSSSRDRYRAAHSGTERRLTGPRSAVAYLHRAAETTTALPRRATRSLSHVRPSRDLKEARRGPIRFPCSTSPGLLSVREALPNSPASAAAAEPVAGSSSIRSTGAIMAGSTAFARLVPASRSFAQRRRGFRRARGIVQSNSCMCDGRAQDSALSSSKAPDRSTDGWTIVNGLPA